MPIVHIGDYLPGVFYVRVTFKDGDSRPCCPPLPEQDHLLAYGPFLHPTKDAAIKAFIDEQGSYVKIARKWWFDPSDLLPPDEQPLNEGHQYICLCRVNEDGEVDCLKRVAYLNLYRGIVRLLDFDEDFLISWSRDDIFKTYEVIDPCAPAPAM